MLAVLSACEQAENRTSERLVFSVEDSATSPNATFDYVAGNFYIQTDGGAFLRESEEEVQSDSAFAPQGLSIIINLPGELIEVLLNPNGYRAETQIELAGGVIKIYHTNQAYLVLSPQGDSLYAVHGEGIVSGGSDLFENIAGLFYEQRTYKILDAAEGGIKVGKISCRYELLVDF